MMTFLTITKTWPHKPGIRKITALFHHLTYLVSVPYPSQSAVAEIVTKTKGTP